MVKRFVEENLRWVDAFPAKCARPLLLARQNDLHRIIGTEGIKLPTDGRSASHTLAVGDEGSTA